MLEELRSNPRSRAARARGCCVGTATAAAQGNVDPRLSTAYAGRSRVRSTGAERSIHRGMEGPRTAKEEVA